MPWRKGRGLHNMSFTPYWIADAADVTPLMVQTKQLRLRSEMTRSSRSRSDWKISLIFKLSFYWHQIHSLLSPINYVSYSLSCYTSLTLNIVFKINEVLLLPKYISEKNEIGYKCIGEGKPCPINKTEVLFCSW